MLSPRFLLRIIYYVLNPWMAAPVTAFLWSRWRGGYQRPGWLGFFAKVQMFDLAQGVVFTGLALERINNQWLRHLTQPIVFTGMLGTLFFMNPGSKPRRLLYGTCLAVGIAAALAGASLDGMKWRNSIFTSTMCLVYLGLVTRELKTLSEATEDVQLTSLPSFWILAALLVYSSGTLIFNASSNYFLRTLPPHLIVIPWLVVTIIHAIHEVMLAKAFLCPTPTSS